jgi:hypothetical protein
MDIKRLLAATAILAASAGTSQAGKVLWTAPALHMYPTNQTLYCDVVNVGTTPQDVTIEILDYYGAVTSGPVTSTLGPEQGNALGEASPLGGARCRFTVSGSTKKVRAIAVYDNGSAYTVAFPAQ